MHNQGRAQLEFEPAGEPLSFLAFLASAAGATSATVGVVAGLTIAFAGLAAVQRYRGKKRRRDGPWSRRAGGAGGGAAAVADGPGGGGAGEVEMRELFSRKEQELCAGSAALSRQESTLRRREADLRARELLSVVLDGV